MGVAIVLVALVLITVLFHIFSPWWLTPISSNWGMIDDTVSITVWVTGSVFVAVNLFMAYAVFRYRHRHDSRAHYEPENRRLELWLTLLTTVGIVAMLAPGLFVWAKYIQVPKDAMAVEVVGQQWQWSYRFPGEDATFGTTDPSHFSTDNPFGMNADDPSGRDDILVSSNELHLPLGGPVKVILRSKDVLHDFAVPQFRAKMDMVPGTVSYFWFTPTREGSYDVLCQELCGIGHYLMRGKVVVQKATDFQSWLAEQPTYEQTRQQAARNIEAGKQLYTACAACHGQDGMGNAQLSAPRLARLPADYIERQLRHFRDGVRGRAEGDTTGQQMAAMVAVLPDQEAMANVAAYIATFDEVPASPTLAGDPRRGKDIFQNCSVCHGKQGQGIWTTSAPPLAGMNDWYLATQLENFRAGIRGAHPGDQYGQQMMAMAAFLGDEQAINDVVSYINTLE